MNLTKFVIFKFLLSIFFIIYLNKPVAVVDPFVKGRISLNLISKQTLYIFSFLPNILSSKYLYNIFSDYSL